MKIALFANEHAGGSKKKNLIPHLQEQIQSAGHSVELFFSEYDGHFEHLLSTMSISPYDTVVALGGDGTNYHVLNGLLRHHSHAELPSLALIPLGSGNSFARDLAITTHEEGIEKILHGRPKPVDVCSFSQGKERYYFINLLGLGFVTDVAETASHWKRFGDFSYVIGVLKQMLFLKFHRIELEVDGAKIEGQNCFLEFCNSRYTGGSMLIAPDARIDDGYFDIVLASPLSRLSLLSTFPKIYKGRHGSNPAVRFLRGQHVRVKTFPTKNLLPDGELFGQTPLEITIHPGLVRYFQ